MLTSTISARDRDELVRQFGALGTRLPPRTDRKDQLAEEWYCLRRYLFVIAAEGSLRYPLDVCKSESPDFLVNRRDGAWDGVEITKATRQEFEADLTNLARGKRTRHYSSDPADGVMLLSMAGWAGDSAEREWAEYMLKAIENKAAVVSNYKRVRECDLLIYDNTPTPKPDLKSAVEFLRGSLFGRREQTGFETGFRTVSLIRDPFVICDVQGGSRFLKYNPEWDAALDVRTA
jgi:hypothetical protein